MRTLIIIPAYNESAVIVNTVNNVKTCHPEVDVLVINDCSRDNTAALLRENHINHLDLPLNLGIGGAVQSGFIYAEKNGYDAAVQLDGDGQHPAEELDKILTPLAAGEADIVIGSRFIEKNGFQSSGMRRAGIRFLRGLLKICTGVRVMDVTSGFRAFDRRAIEVFCRDYSQDYPEPDAIVTARHNNLRILEVPVVMKERQGGVSSISPLKSVYYMIKVSLAIVVRSLGK